MIDFKKILPAVRTDIANSLAHADMKKAISSSIPYLLIFFISNKISYLSRVNFQKTQVLKTPFRHG